MSLVDTRYLELVFGASQGQTAEACASTSSRRFVRGLDLLTVERSAKATGRRLSAREALDAYGFDKLLEAAIDGSAILSETIDAAGRVLRERREQLALSVKSVAAKTGLSPVVLTAMEESRRRPIREYERVARVLGLDERMISFRREPQGSQGVAVRLRTLHDERPVLNSSVVLAIAEAAWVAATQSRVEAMLLPARQAPQQEPERDYGSPWTPAYRVGYRLARELRSRLGLGHQPIASMRDLVERRLRIPVIGAPLEDRIAGATIDTGDQRAIVINCWGRNEIPFFARSTLAHELGHLLFDPQHRLHSLRVDEYSEIEQRFDQITDPVEQRANAFAIEFLAPQQALLEIYHSGVSDPVATMIERFGISFKSCRYHLWNAIEHARPLESLVSAQTQAEYNAKVRAWEGPERYTTIWHPIPSLVDHPSRAGRFSAVALRAAEAGVISWDTASEWLLCTVDELQQAAPAMRELYADLFA